MSELAPDPTFPRVPLTEDGDTEILDDRSGREASLWRDAWRQLRRNPAFIVGVSLIGVYVLIGVIPGVIAPQGVGRALCQTASGSQPPSAEFIFGLDDKGCPYYPRVIYGARPSLIIGPAVATFAFLIAITFGTIAGYYSGFVDSLIARATDIVLGLPLILGALVAVSTLNGYARAIKQDPTLDVGFVGFLNDIFTKIDSAAGTEGIGVVIVTLVVFGWATMLRLARSSTLSVTNSDYVEAARALGASDLRIMTRHIIPNALAPVLVYVTITVGVAIVAEAALSFLGVGLRQPAISWGVQLSAARAQFRTSPHLMLFPGVFLAGLVFAFIVIGDALRDALDPKLR